MTRTRRAHAPVPRWNRVGQVGLWLGVLMVAVFGASLFGVGIGARGGAEISLVLGAVATVLGVAGLVLCWMGWATNLWASVWAVTLGVVLGVLPMVLLIAALA